MAAEVAMAKLPFLLVGIINSKIWNHSKIVDDVTYQHDRVRSCLAHFCLHLAYVGCLI